MLPDHHVPILLVGGDGRGILVVWFLNDVDQTRRVDGDAVPAHAQAIDVVAGGSLGVHDHKGQEILVHGDVVDQVYLVGLGIGGQDEGRARILYNPSGRDAKAGNVAGRARKATRGVHGVPDHQVLVAVTVPGHAGRPEAPVRPGDDLKVGVGAGRVPGDDPAPDLIDAWTGLLHPDHQVLVVRGIVRHSRLEAAIGARGDTEPAKHPAGAGHTPGVDVPEATGPGIVPDHQVLAAKVVVGHLWLVPLGVSIRRELDFSTKPGIGCRQVTAQRRRRLLRGAFGDGAPGQGQQTGDQGGRQGDEEHFFRQHPFLLDQNDCSIAQAGLLAGDHRQRDPGRILG